MDQKIQQVQITKALSRIEHELSELKNSNKKLQKRISELEFENYYPPVSKIKKSYIKKIKKIDSEIKRGKYNTYKSVKEFDRAIKTRL